MVLCVQLAQGVPRYIQNTQPEARSAWVRWQKLQKLSLSDVKLGNQGCYLQNHETETPRPLGVFCIHPWSSSPSLQQDVMKAWTFWLQHLQPTFSMSTPMGFTHCSHKFPHPPLWHSMMPCNKADASPVTTSLWYTSWSLRSFFRQDLTLYYLLLKLSHLNHVASFTLGHVPCFFHFFCHNLREVGFAENPTINWFQVILSKVKLCCL